MCIPVLCIDLLKFVHFLSLTSKILDNAYARNMLLQEGIQVRHPFPDIDKCGLHRFFKNIGCRDHQRHRNEHDKCQLPVRIKHDSQNDCKLQQIADDLDQSFRKDIGQCLQIRDGPRDQLAQGSTVKIFQAQLNNMIKHLNPDITDHGLSQGIGH